MRSRRLAAAVVTGVLLVTSGCGSGTAPADDVPALATALDEVDEAIAAGDYDAAGDAITELADVARQAGRDGDLEKSETDRITAAADALLEALPEGDADVEEEPAEPTPEPSPEAPTTSTPFEEGDEDDEDDEDSGGKPEKPGKPDKPGKPEKKDKDD